MKAPCWSIFVALLLAAPSVSVAQQARVVDSEPIQLTTQADIDRANRETLGTFLSRDEVRRAAVIARVDIGQTMAAVNTMDSDRLEALEAGCDAFATKPIDFPELLAKIEALTQR